MSHLEYLGDSKEVNIDSTGLLWLRQLHSDGRSISIKMDDTVLGELISYLKEHKPDLFLEPEGIEGM